MQIEETAINSQMKKSGINFLGILNDIKRRPEDAAKELQIPLEEINAIIEGMMISLKTYLDNIPGTYILRAKLEL